VTSSVRRRSPGAKPRPDAITATAGELRLERLAAAGVTNREIAQALFITTNTADAHAHALAAGRCTCRAAGIVSA